ncbi:MAG: ATP-binding cassette domain-containing protein [Coriobacteriia bacterium]|nr:ATP-binding cassette domain-containing protein [Coriobacteriia bacterium]
MSLVVDIKKDFGSFVLDVSFEADNETLGFLGASGCGKSLTLRSIAGIEEPDEGKIVVNGTTYFDRVPGKRARVNLSPQERKTAMLFQNYQLFPNLTVRQNIAAGIPRSTPKDEVRKLVDEQLLRFGLVDKEERYPLQLSGGQQQRVALGRMLAARPGILMLDEPFSALDSHMKSALDQNLLGLFDEFEGTILYVSHDIDEAFRFCDRIAVVESGHIEEVALKRDLVNHPKSLAAIKLSGCKNTSRARKVDDRHLALLDYGIVVETSQDVPADTTFAGVRAFRLERAWEPGPNVFRVRCDRVSDARFDRTVMVSFVDADPTLQALKKENANTPRPKGTQGPSQARQKKPLFPWSRPKLTQEEHLEPQSEEHSMRFLRTHMQWRIDKLATGEDGLPEEGDELLLRIPPERLYLVNH